MIWLNAVNSGENVGNLQQFQRRANAQLLRRSSISLTRARYSRALWHRMSIVSRDSDFEFCVQSRAFYARKTMREAYSYWSCFGFKAAPTPIDRDGERPFVMFNPISKFVNIWRNCEKQINTGTQRSYSNSAIWNFTDAYTHTYVCTYTRTFIICAKANIPR